MVCSGFFTLAAVVDLLLLRTEMRAVDAAVESDVDLAVS